MVFPVGKDMSHTTRNQLGGKEAVSAKVLYFAELLPAFPGDAVVPRQTLFLANDRWEGLDRAIEEPDGQKQRGGADRAALYAASNAQVRS